MCGRTAGRMVKPSTAPSRNQSSRSAANSAGVPTKSSAPRARRCSPPRASSRARVARAASRSRLEHDVDGGQDRDVVGIASGGRRALADRRDDGGSPTRRRARRRTRGRRTSRDRQRQVVTGIHGHDRLALRRPRRDRRAAHTEEPALEVDVVELVAVDVAAGRLVADDGVVLPAVPEAHDDVDGLVRLGVELGRRRRVLAPEVRGFGLGGGHRDLPAGPSAADVVERGHVLGDVERLGVRGGHGGHEPDRTGQRRDAREREQGVETAAHAAAVARLQRERVVDGDEVEAGRVRRRCTRSTKYSPVNRSCGRASRSRHAPGWLPAPSRLTPRWSWRRGGFGAGIGRRGQLGVLAPNNSPSSGTDSNPSGPTGRSPTRVTRSTRRS